MVNLNMNYLAHAYLSFGDPSILTGNIISDFIKGKKKYNYNKDIFNGIRLHRAIDDFTDQHSSTKAIKKYFSSYYGLYASVFADIAYDYFVANDTRNFKNVNELELFSQKCYQQLDQNYIYLPDNFRLVFASMKHHNWLFNYKLDTGIEHSFRGIVARAKYMSDAETAFKIFFAHKEQMQEFYYPFFPQLKLFAESALEQLLGDD